jgi:hypothetical protein
MKRRSFDAADAFLLGGLIALVELVVFWLVGA